MLVIETGSQSDNGWFYRQEWPLGYGLVGAAILILYGIILTFIVQERSPVHLDSYIIELKNLARSHNALASCRGTISSCRGLRPGFGLFKNPVDRLA